MCVSALSTGACLLAIGRRIHRSVVINAQQCVVQAGNMHEVERSIKQVLHVCVASRMFFFVRCSIVLSSLFDAEPDGPAAAVAPPHLGDMFAWTHSVD